MHSRRELLSRTIANAQRFERICFELAAIKAPSKKMKAIEVAAHFANGTGAGVYRSRELEAALSELAKMIASPIDPGKTDRSGVLHVMSTAFPWGGHTRVVERWIDLDGEKRSQSVVLTEQGTQPVPKLLNDVVTNAGGAIHRLRDKKSIETRAEELKSIALGYAFIVLHIHMHDIVPSLAFGLPSFPVPVIFYNHADHRFSVGMEVAHAVAETRSWGRALTGARRGIPNSKRLGIPLSIKETGSSTDQGFSRDQLSIPKEAKIAIASASQYKFQPFLDLNFFETVKKLLRRNNRIWVLLVGVSETFCRQQLIAAGCDAYDLQRVIPIRACDEAQFKSYLKAADVALDTLPENGCTAAMDYISNGLPVVSRKTFIGQMDYLIDQPEYVRTDDEFIDQVLGLMDANNDHKITAARQFENLNNDCRSEVFLGRLDDLYTSATVKNPVGLADGNLFHGFSDLDLFHTHRTTLI
ncbi:hypothetical protein [Ruegeria sp. A3M17]|uniref:hypothetical protein n=1 Tax=Ruegeria sp. A3M17 TaxID=2267229 RepID=UPI000DEBDC86|nr:hypothetical protein [Ruegeria sp. A3M17]RBW54978.1 hypothetical protein DS906_15790 [Ruegeria sp. A3M17]